jgi:TRAP-type C4-dicarboxylate transport system substrate-binding protein
MAEITRRGFNKGMMGAMAAGSMAAAGIGRAHAAEYELVAGLQVNPDSPFDKGLRKLAELVEERSEGRLVIRIYTSGQLGNEPELFQGMMGGTVDIAVVAPGQIAEWVPEIALLELPFLITSPEQRDRVVEGEPMQRPMSRSPAFSAAASVTCSSASRSRRARTSRAAASACSRAGSSPIPTARSAWSRS